LQLNDTIAKIHSVTAKQWVAAFALLLFFILVAYTLHSFGYIEFFAVIPITLLTGLGLMYYPKIWISLYILLIGPYLISGGEGVSVLEVILAGGLNGGLLLWLLGYKSTNTGKYIRGFSEYLFVVFHILVIFNFFIAYANDADLFNWVRVYLRISLVFYYIPLRVYFGDKEGLKYISKLFIVVILFVLGNHFYTYYTYVTKIEMAYQIGKGVRDNLSLLVALIVTLGGLVYSNKGKLVRAALLFLLSLTIAAMITTFARTFWLTSIIGFGLLFLYLKPKEKISTLVFFFFFSIIVVFSLQLVLDDIFGLAIKSLSERVSSTTKGTKDVSLLMRLVEYDEAFKQISYYPWAGKGFASKIDFYIPYVLQHWNTHNIHNAFIYTAFKTGIPMMLIYSLAIVMMGIRSFKAIRLQKDNWYKYLSVGVFSGFLSIYLASLLSNQFFERDSVTLISFLIYYSSVLYSTGKTDNESLLVDNRKEEV
jgi:hypothetical protein